MTKRQERDGRIIAEVTVEFLEKDNRALSNLLAAAHTEIDALKRDRDERRKNQQGLLNTICRDKQTIKDLETRIEEQRATIGLYEDIIIDLRKAKQPRGKNGRFKSNAI